MTRTASRWLMSVALAILALVAINLLVTTAPVQGRPAAALINCTGSIQACIDAANDGDTILIAAGRYTESLTLSKPVSLTGVSSDTTIIHAVAGQRVLTVTGVTIDNSVVISGLTFTGGDVTSGSYVCPQNCGGGIWIDDAAQPTLESIIVANNAADRIGGIRARVLILKDSLIINNIGGGADAFTATIDGGQFTGNTNFGGLVVESLTLNGTTFISNSSKTGTASGGATVYQTAIISGAQFEDNIGGDGLGGGALQARNAPLIITNTLFRHNNNSAIYVDNADTILNHCRFEDNYDATYGAGIWAFGFVTATDTLFISNTAKDGGAGLTATNANISGGAFQNNHSTEIYGGGLYVLGEATITGTDFVSNSAESGGGAYLGTAVIANAYFSQNIATSFVGGGLSAGDLSLSHVTLVNNNAIARGGGAFVYGTTSITDSRIISNTAQSGGAGAFVQSTAYITNSRFEGNTSNSQQYAGGIFAHTLWTTNTVFVGNSSLHAGGAQAGYANINGGRFERNISEGFGGGLAVNDLFMTGTVIISNTAGGGGGAWVPHTAWLNGVRFENNRALGNDPRWTNGGGLLVEHGSLFMSDTQFISNSAVTFGGGLSLSRDASGRVVNTVFAHNRSNSSGAAIATTTGGSLGLLHTTIADSILNPQPAIAVLSGTLNLTNTIIASHTIGISNAGGTVYEDYNLFYGNITNTIDVTSGGHSLDGDPKFVDPLNGDYHLQFGSAAIDRGADAGVYTDLDGKSRPIGAGFDIGAYEYQAIKVVYLPLIRK